MNFLIYTSQRGLTGALLLLLLAVLSGCENQADFGRVTGGSGGGGGDVVVSDVPIVSIQSTLFPDLIVPEGDGPSRPIALAFQATITPALKEDANFIFGIISETATIPSRNLITFVDVSIAGQPSSGVELKKGATEFSFSVQIQPDSIYEPGGETFFMRYGTSNSKALKINPNLYDATTGTFRQRVKILDDDPKPAVGFSDISTKTASEAEGFASLTVVLMPNLTNGSLTKAGSNIKIPVTYTPITGTLSPLTDFTQIDYVIFAPEKETADFKFLINDDAVAEGMESMQITLGTPFNADLAAGFGEVIVNIQDDDGGLTGLNDTGVTTCAPTGNCGNQDYPMQDGDIVGSGFNFSKLDVNGNGPLNDLTTDFSCVRDNNTNLTWEVKVFETGSVQNPGNIYSWLDARANANGGDKGFEGSTSGCALTTSCNTQEYIDEINKLALCGKSGWRLPKLHELLSLMDLGSDTSDNIAPALITGTFKTFSLLTRYFPNIGRSSGRYWSATPVAGFKDKAWAVYFGADPADSKFNYVTPEAKTSTFNVRLVTSN